MPIAPKCSECPVRECFIHACCPPEWLEGIEGGKSPMVFDRGQWIIHEGNPVLGIYFIFSGRIKVVSSGYNGKKQTVRLTQSGDILGHRGYGGELYPIGAKAMERSVVCFFDNDTMHRAFLENPQLTYALMMYYSKELRRTEARIKYLAQMSVPERVTEALWFIAKTYGTEQDNGAVLVDLKRKEIANLAGVNADQVSRVLKELREEGAIVQGREEIRVLSLDRLFSKISMYMPPLGDLF